MHLSIALAEEFWLHWAWHLYRSPSPEEMANETDTLPNEIHHETLPGEAPPAYQTDHLRAINKKGREVHVFVPTGYMPTGGGCTAMWTQVAPGEWTCHNTSAAVEGISSAHREDPQPELRFVAPMLDSSDRNEEPQLTVTGEHTIVSDLAPARIDGGSSADGWLAGWLAGNQLFIQKQRRGY